MAGSFFPPQGGGASSFSQIQGTIQASQIPNSIVVDSMVAAAAGIQESKFAALGINKALITDASGVITVHANTTSTEIGYLNGVTSAIQTQINGKQASLGYTAENTANKGAASGYAGLNASSQITNALAALSQLPALNNSIVVVTTAGGVLTSSSVTTTTLGFLDATSSIQTQLNGKQASLGYTAENVANKGAASGYAGLNGSSQITNSLANLNQLPALNNSIVVVTTGAGVLTSSTVTTTTLGFLDATSSIQTQLNGKATSGSALTESAEQSSIPVVDNLDATQGGQRLYAFFTVPSTYKFVIITGIEWKNGATVNGNAIAGVDLVDANPPTVAHTPLVAFTQQVAVAGASSVQRISTVSSKPIRGNTIIGIWFMFSSGTATVKYLSGQPSQNIFKNIAFTGVPPNADATAWGASTNRPYVKVYYVGYT